MKAKRLGDTTQKLQKSKQNLETIRTMINDSGKDELSLTDSQSRLMKNNGKIEVCYNAELSIDSKKHLIVDYSVTNEANDERQLAPMADCAVKNRLYNLPLDDCYQLKHE